MKLLLTSGGIRNASLHDALVRLLGKPIAECSALLVPTALYGHPQGTPGGPGALSTAVLAARWANSDGSRLACWS